MIYKSFITSNYQSKNVDTYLFSDIESIKSMINNDNRPKAIIIDEKITHINDYHLLTLQIPSFKINALEKNKDLSTVSSIVSWLISLNFPSDGLLIGIGGGITTDLCGFVANIYHRGIACWFVPTTLLAQVDAAIGGKNGCNCDNIKNVIGCVYHPEKILISSIFLNTLSNNELRNGYSEIIKIACLLSNDLFSQLENHQIEINNLIKEAIKLKTQLVVQDEFSKNQRHALNFGHTIGHAIESCSNYTISHGEAIAIGMIMECNHPKVRKRLSDLLFNYHLLDHYEEIQQKKLDIIKYLKYDKKITNDLITIVKFNDIGDYQLTKIALDTLFFED